MTIKKKKKSENTFLPATLTVPTDYSISKVGTSQTLMLKFLSCRKAWLYSINKVRSYAVNERTNFGSMFHHVLDKVYGNQNGYIDLISNIIQEYLTKNKDALQRLDLQKLEKDVALCQVLAEEYFDFYRSDDKEKSFTEVEQEISVKIGKYQVHCKLDGRFKDKSGFIWNMEHKTKSRISEDNMMKRLSFDTQNLFYLIASEKFYKEKVHGVLYNVVRTPQLKLGKTETLKAFAERVRADIRERKDWYFIRYEIPYTELDKQNAMDRFTEIMNEMENVCDGKQKIFENTGACEGLYTCEYLDACMSNSFEGYYVQEKIFKELETVKH